MHRAVQPSCFMLESVFLPESEGTHYIHMSTSTILVTQVYVSTKYLGYFYVQVSTYLHDIDDTHSRPIITSRKNIKQRYILP